MYWYYVMRKKILVQLQMYIMASSLVLPRDRCPNTLWMGPGSGEYRLMKVRFMP